MATLMKLKCAYCGHAYLGPTPCDGAFQFCGKCGETSVFHSFEGAVQPDLRGA